MNEVERRLVAEKQKEMVDFIVGKRGQSNEAQRTFTELTKTGFGRRKDDFSLVSSLLKSCGSSQRISLWANKALVKIDYQYRLKMLQEQQVAV